MPAPDPPLATPLGLLTWRSRRAGDMGLVRDLFRPPGLAPPRDVAALLDARERHRDATRPGAQLGIVTLDAEDVGQLDLHHTDGAVEVLEIALVPAVRGRGLGTALLRHVLGEADAAGRVARLHVEPANPALRLYERLGFSVVGSEGLHLSMERAPGAYPPPTWL